MSLTSCTSFAGTTLVKALGDDESIVESITRDSPIITEGGGPNGSGGRGGGDPGGRGGNHGTVGVACTCG
jgi:hypothetical protein